MEDYDFDYDEQRLGEAFYDREAVFDKYGDPILNEDYEGMYEDDAYEKFDYDESASYEDAEYEESWWEEEYRLKAAHPEITGDQYYDDSNYREDDYGY